MIRDSMVSLGWLERTDRNINMINREFSGLNNTRLNDTTHMQGYSIMDILMTMTLKNHHFIQLLEQALQRLPHNLAAKSYKMGWAWRILFRFLPGLPMKKRSARLLSGDIKKADLFLRLNDQYQKIADLILLHEKSDMNKSIVPFGKGGLLKISTGDFIEYMLAVQEKHLMYARRILMLQDL